MIVSKSTEECMFNGICIRVHFDSYTVSEGCFLWGLRNPFLISLQRIKGNIMVAGFLYQNY